jgi:MinD superfamily P-loop ATPase
VARIPDASACTGCGICEDFCPVQAIVVGTNGSAQIDPAVCCGCGQCAFHCPEENVQLEPSERDVFLPILEPSQRRISS